MSIQIWKQNSMVVTGKKLSSVSKANRLDMETISEKKEKAEEAYKSNLRNVFFYLSSVII